MHTRVSSKVISFVFVCMMAITFFPAAAFAQAISTNGDDSVSASVVQATGLSENTEGIISVPPVVVSASPIPSASSVNGEGSIQTSAQLSTASSVNGDDAVHGVANSTLLASSENVAEVGVVASSVVAATVNGDDALTVQANTTAVASSANEGGITVTSSSVAVASSQNEGGVVASSSVVIASSQNGGEGIVTSNTAVATSTSSNGEDSVETHASSTVIATSANGEDAVMNIVTNAAVASSHNGDEAVSPIVTAGVSQNGGDALVAIPTGTSQNGADGVIVQVLPLSGSSENGDDAIVAIPAGISTNGNDAVVSVLSTPTGSSDNGKDAIATVPIATSQNGDDSVVVQVLPTGSSENGDDSVVPPVVPPIVVPPVVVPPVVVVPPPVILPVVVVVVPPPIVPPVVVVVPPPVVIPPVVVPPVVVVPPPVVILPVVETVLVSQVIVPGGFVSVGYGGTVDWTIPTAARVAVSEGGVSYLTGGYGECVRILKYAHIGEANDPFEVLKIQNFLRRYEGAMHVPTSGIYDQTTFEAVEAFQQKYVNEVLAPWGAMEPTGYAYITTLRKMNDILCGIMSLTASDKAIIAAYRSTHGGNGVISSIDGDMTISPGAESSNEITPILATSTPTSTSMEVGQATPQKNVWTFLGNVAVTSGNAVVDFFKWGVRGVARGFEGTARMLGNSFEWVADSFRTIRENPNFSAPR